MKALMKTEAGVGNVKLVDVPEPVCGDDGVKLEVKYTGICGTDLHVYYDTFKNYPLVILGHEFSGIITETGKNVKKIKVGDRVSVLGSTMVKCGKCEYCTQGNYMFCSIRRGRDMALAEALRNTWSSVRIRPISCPIMSA